MTETVARQTILLVDDNEAVISGLIDLLGNQEFKFVSATTSEQALSSIEDIREPVIVILDWWIKNNKGESVHSKDLLPTLIRNSCFPPLVIVISMDNSPSARAASIDVGADWFVSKDILSEMILRQVRFARGKFQIIAMQTCDALTQAYHRPTMYERMTTELARAFRTKTSIACIVLDLDNFKVINDTFGHLAGDAIISNAFKSVRSNIRSHTDILCRPGGDEIFLFIVGVDTPNSVMRLTKQILETISANKVTVIKSDGSPVSIGVTASAGFSMITHDKIVSELALQNSSAQHPSREEQVAAFWNLITKAINEADTNMYLHKKSKKPAQ